MNKCKILFAMAPTSDQADRFFSTTCTSLLWASALLIYLIDNGKLEGVEYVSRVYDPLRVREETWNEYEQLLRNEKPNILVLSSTYDSHHNARHMAMLAKNISDCLVIYGGPHVREVCKPHVAELMPQVYPFNEPDNPFDFIVEGDGEYPLVKLVEVYSRLFDKTALLSYFSSEGAAELQLLPGNSRIHFVGPNGVERVTTSKKRLHLDSLPTMPRHLLANNPMDLYGFSCFYENGPNGRKLLPSTQTLLHRGCKSGCNFCSERGGYNQRGHDHLLTEIHQLKAQGFKGVFFDDSTTGDHFGFYEETLPALKKTGLQFAGLNRFDKLQNIYQVQQMADAGWVYQYCSIEHLHNDVLALSNKRQSVKEIVQGMQNMQAVGMELGVSLLFGLRGETEESIKTTLRFVAEYVERGLITCVSLSMLSFHPGVPQTLITEEGKAIQSSLRFDQGAPHSGYPWNRFEEGRWFHPEWVTAERASYIAELADQYVGSMLVRNMQKDGIALES